jgi:fused signal recognition particle receptor
MTTDNKEAQPKKGFFGRLFKGKEAASPENENEGEALAAENLEAQVSHDVIADQQQADLEAEIAHATAAEDEEAQRERVPLEQEAKTPAESIKKGWLSKLSSGLSRSSTQLTSGITGLFTKAKLDAATLDDLEDLLIQADLGVETSLKITDALSSGRFDKSVSPAQVQAILAEEVTKVLSPVAQPLVIEASKKPFVILMIGVNGAGKTTTIGKLASKLKAEGKSVMLAAGDTFRAAAVSQLKVWAERSGSGFVSAPEGSDAASLAFEAIEKAEQDNVDVLIIDTAGRLQNRAELMAELEKVVRVIKKKVPDAPHATLLVLDATTGQNALNQVEIFSKSAGATGLVMTKLDGTARGGILVAIAAKYAMPVHFIGVGEGIEDLQPFAAIDFASAIAGLPVGTK